MRINKLLLCSLLAVIVLTGFQSVPAAVFTVTKTVDTNDGVCDGDCSLREAVDRANTLSSDDVIIFSPTMAGATVTVTSPVEITGTGKLTIEGLDANRITISGGNSVLIFKVSNAIAVRFAGMKLTGGRALANPDIGGAAIRSRAGASLDIDRVHFAGNTTINTGGIGGAIALSGGTHRISNCTFTGNSAPWGGAIHSSANLTIVNSTFASNQGGSGGAMWIGGQTKMRNVTITGNVGTFAGSMQIASGGSLNIGNTLIANGFAQVSNWNIQLDAGGALVSSGNNLIGNIDTLGNVKWQTSDARNSSPAIGNLLDNGGSMPTMLPGSGPTSLIDNGSNALANEEGLAIDQRGYARTANGTVDKGAVEADSAPAWFTVKGQVRNASGRILPRARVTITDMTGFERNFIANSLGYYSFTVPAGESYLVRAILASHQFRISVINVNRDLSGVDLAAD